MTFYTDELWPGDIVLVCGSGWLSDAIREFTPRDNRIPIQASHCGIFGHYWPAVDDGAYIESAFHGVRYNDLTRNDPLLIIRATNLDISQRIRIGQGAAAYYQRRYGFERLGLHLLDNLLARRFAPGRDLYIARRLATREPVCSGVVAHPYEAEGFDFGVKAQAANPHDIHEFAVLSGKYATVGIKGQWLHAPPPWTEAAA